MDMLETIIEAKTNDGQLAGLFDETREYAQIYLLAKQRHKGCAGTGEFMTLKEEFKYTIDMMILYCRNNNLLPNDCTYDPDVIAAAPMENAR